MKFVLNELKNGYMDKKVLNMRFNNQSQKKWLALCGLVMLILICSVCESNAEIFTVTKVEDTNDGICDTDCSFREAIIMANARLGEDSILVPSGTYARTSFFPTIIDDVKIIGEEVGTTIIDANAIGGSVLVIDGPSKIEISNLTIQGGVGGGISKREGDLTVTNCMIRGNSASLGGGISNRKGVLTLKNSIVAENSATAAFAGYGGGGIHNTATLTMIDSEVLKNFAASSGGGIYNSGTMNIANSTISGNTTPIAGAGIFNGGNNIANMTIMNSTISGNSAIAISSCAVCGRGGGIYNQNIIAISNSTISGNVTDVFRGWEGVGGIYNGGSISLINSTIVGNFTDIGISGIRNNGEITFSNSLISNDCGGSTIVYQYHTSGGNLESPGDTCGLIDLTDQVNIPDPMIDLLSDNGGPTLTHALLPGSPAIDMARDINCPAMDQRGATRVDGKCDVGAFEADAVFGFAIKTSIPAAMKLNQFVSFQLETVDGDAGTLFWSVSDGTLPHGLNLSADGVLSGSPTELGNFYFRIRVTSAEGGVTEKSFTTDVVFIFPPPDIRIHKTGTTAVPGRILDYYIVVENVGRDPARNVEILEILDPQYFSLISVEPPGVADVPTLASASIVSWIIPTIMPGEAKILFYQVRLNPVTLVGTEVIGGPVCGGENLTTEWLKCINDGLKAFPLCSVCVPACQACGILCLPPEIGECPTCLGICATCLVGIPMPGGKSCLTSVWGFAKDCFEAIKQTTSCASDNQTTTRPADPNEKEVVAKRFIQPDQLLVYPIHFENIGEVEALDVFVTDKLDPNLDVSTLQIITPNGSFDPLTKTVSWALLGRNLQPGETGNVLLAINPLPKLPSGTEIHNDATIQFEIFEEILTNEVVNIIDTTLPSCVMDALPNTNAPEFTISWNGVDPIGEIDSYSVFVSVDGQGFTPYLEGVQDTNAVFAGERGKSYEFLCVAVDTAGNVEDQSLAAEAVTTIFANSPPVANAGPDQILECTSPVGVSATLDGSASTDPDDDILTFLWTGSFGATNEPNPSITLPVDSHVITLTVDDSRGGSGSDTVTITVEDTVSPKLHIPEDIVRECIAPNGQGVDIGIPLAEDICTKNVVISNNAPELFALGSTDVTWSAADGFGNKSQAIQSVNIVDTTPPDLSILCSPNMLWPPNHKMVEVIPGITAHDICDASLTVKLDRIVASEGDKIDTYDPVYDGGLEDGNTANDVLVDADGRIYLRAERSGENSGGRTYTINYKATDVSGNMSTASCDVLVPHDMR